MGFWAHLTDDRGHDDGEWNYTHNCNGMATVALESAGVELPDDTTPCSRRENGEWVRYPDGHGKVSWWRHLSGMSGPDGAALLDTILRELTKDPDRYRAMNPANGWGSYDSFVELLTSMRAAVPEWPTTWQVNG